MKISTAMPLGKTSLVSVILLFSMILAGCDEEDGHGLQAHAAKIFKPGHFSTGLEYGVTFSPDGQFIYFTRGTGIYWAQWEGDGWSSPQLAEFSKGAWISDYLADGAQVEYFDWDPVISPDGSKLFIMSHGLVDGKIIAGEDGDLDLWVLNREGEGFDGASWGPPQHLGAAINTPEYSEGAIGISSDGTVYFFSSNRPDGLGKGDIYYSEYVNGEYLPAVNIGAPINTPSWDGHTYADPEGKFLLYISNNLPGGYGDCDIYVSRKTEAGWAEPVNLGPNVNTDACELTPSLTPDGKTLFFGRIEGGDREADVRNIYYIDLDNTDF